MHRFLRCLLPVALVAAVPTAAQPLPDSLEIRSEINEVDAAVSRLQRVYLDMAINEGVAATLGNRPASGLVDPRLMGRASDDAGMTDRLDERRRELERAEQREVVRVLLNTERIAADMSTGVSAVFGGAGLSLNEITLTRETAVWRNETLTNGWNRVSTIQRLVEPLVLGGAILLNSQGDTDIGGLLAAGYGILSPILGGLASRNQVDATSAINSLGSQLGTDTSSIRRVLEANQQIALSQHAYRDLQGRANTADEYFDRARALLPRFTAVKDRARELQDAIQNTGAIPAREELNAVVDSLLVLVSDYDDVGGFFDLVLTQFVSQINAYSRDYPVLVPNLQAARSRAELVTSEFNRIFVNGTMKDVPQMRDALSRWRLVQPSP